MEEIIGFILQFIIEFLLESLLYDIFDWPVSRRTRSEPAKPIARSTLWFILGCLIAAGSLYFFPRSFISVPALRVTNLILAPIFSAYVAREIAIIYRRSNSAIIPHNHFWQAFWFTLGLTGTRFLYIYLN